MTAAAAAPPRRLAPALLVMGKGGVGKTTVAAGLAALEVGTHGMATLVEFGDGAAGRRALAGCKASVEHVVVRADEALQRGATSLFGSAVVARLALGNFAMRPLLRVAPAVRELAMLEAVRQLVADRPGVRVVVDMPATGHGVAWLRVPRQGRDFLGAGPLFALCDRVARELLSPGRASIVVVTLPERLVLEETRELCDALAHEVGLAPERVAVNRMPLPVAPESLTDALSLASTHGPLAPAARALADTLTARASARAEAEAALAALALPRHALWHIPAAPVDPSAHDVARWLRAEGAP